MWAKNGALFLPYTLKRIEEAIPHEYVGQKIFIDDNSSDETPLIAKDFSWSVYRNEKGGIGNGANLALSKVKTPIFASFEQDLLLNKNWFDKIFPLIEKKSVAVAQGWRFSTNKTQRVLEEFAMDWFKKLPLYSLDNTLYKTSLIKSVGGFPTYVTYCVDGVLRAKIIRAGYNWVTNCSVISAHIKPFNIFDYAKRYERMSHDLPVMVEEGLLPEDEIKKLKFHRQLIKALYSPLIGAGLAVVKRDPMLFLYYPLMRIFRTKGYVVGKKLNLLD